PFLEVLPADLRLLAPDDDSMPFGPLLLRARFVRPLLVGREGEVADRILAGGVFELRIPPQITDQDHFVDARHCSSSMLSQRKTLPPMGTANHRGSPKLAGSSRDGRLETRKSSIGRTKP